MKISIKELQHKLNDRLKQKKIRKGSPPVVLPKSTNLHLPKRGSL